MLFRSIDEQIRDGEVVVVIGPSGSGERCFSRCLTLLEQQIGKGDLGAAFETAHALKGMYANLSLSPLTKPVSEITELLRSRTETDYSSLITDAKVQFDLLCNL